MSKVHPITQEKLDNFGFDDDNYIYWKVDGKYKKLKTEEKITLNWWVNGAVIIGALSTATLAVIEFLRFFYYG